MFFVKKKTMHRFFSVPKLSVLFNPVLFYVVHGMGFSARSAISISPLL